MEQHGGRYGDDVNRPNPARLLTWQRLSSPQRYEAYTKWSFVGLFLFAPLMAIMAIPADRVTTYIPADAMPAVLVAFISCMLVVSGAGSGAFLSGLQYALGRRTLPTIWLAVLGVATLAALGLGSFIYISGDPQTAERALLPVVFGFMAIFIPAITVIGTLARWGWLVVFATVCAAVAALPFAFIGVPGVAIAAMLAVAIGGLSFGISVRVAVWSVVLVWDLERRREIDAELAVAEERLRFSRDLHDVFGRTLSTVAVKSELAAVLAGRGDPRGQEEMMRVRGIAQDALKEVRAVVQGYRAANLTAEFAGAREILTASGVQVEVDGDDVVASQSSQQVLAWVLREGVTNVVRHSAATHCSIVLRRTEADSHEGRPGLRLQITNDGVLSRAEGRTKGTGLHGLSERLTDVSGTVSTDRQDSTFTLTAWVPDAPARAQHTTSITANERADR